MKLNNNQSWLHWTGWPGHINTSERSISISSIIRSPAFAIILVSCIWLGMVILVNPVGEFPLNDDWSYARPVQILVEQGRLELSGFTSMPLIAQVLWGALFCLLFGFSFTVLRISTIVLGLIGILATYWLIVEISKNRMMALGGALVVATNPLYLNLSLTFMTDVPFFAFSMLAILFFLRALRKDQLLDYALGYLFTLIAILIRQLAIVIPLSFLLANIIKYRFNKKVFIYALLPTGVFAGLLLIYPTLLKHTIGLPALYNRAYEPIAENIPLGWFQTPLVYADRLLVELMYLGLFFLPFLFMLGINIDPALSIRKRRLSILIGLVLFGAILVYLLSQGRVMPLTGNMLVNLGLGPLLLRDTYILNLPHWPSVPKELWYFVTAAAALGAVAIIFRIGSSGIQNYKLLKSGLKSELIDTTFLLSLASLYFLIIGITGFLDRYLIWLLPLLMCIMLAQKRHDHLRNRVFSTSISLAIIFIVGFFAIGSTHDYLAWNRTRWQAVTDLQQQGISYTNIDGGFEFNGWYSYDAGYQMDTSKSWWWVENDDFVISFGPLPNYVEIKKYPFERWIPPGDGSIFVLQRQKD